MGTKNSRRLPRPGRRPDQHGLEPDVAHAAPPLVRALVPLHARHALAADYVCVSPRRSGSAP